MPIPSWRLFEVEVRHACRLSPSFLRVTFTGAGLDRFADNGLDQRIKVVFPLPGLGVTPLPEGVEWYPAWRDLPPDLRNPFRTYTVRAVRPHLHEVDVDMVLHAGGDGPAARWASSARVGDRAALVGPDAGYDGDHGGRDFRPGNASTILLAGDETALPAIVSILDALGEAVYCEVLLELPYVADVRALATEVEAPFGVSVSWLAREGSAPGCRLIPAVRAAAARLLPAAPNPTPVPDVDIDDLWEVPSAPAPSGLYAWLAGEAGVIAEYCAGTWWVTSGWTGVG